LNFHRAVIVFIKNVSYDGYKCKVLSLLTLLLSLLLLLTLLLSLLLLLTLLLTLSIGWCPVCRSKITDNFSTDNDDATLNDEKDSNKKCLLDKKVGGIITFDESKLES